MLNERTPGRRQQCFRWGLVVALAAATAGGAQAQTIVRGVVIEEGSLQPIAAVELRALDAAGDLIMSGLTDGDGRFRMTFPDSASFSLAVRRVGYSHVRGDSLRVGRDEALELQIKLNPNAVALEPVTVIGRSFEPYRISQFKERAALSQRMGRGRILMRDDLERYALTSANDVLSSLTPSSRCRYDVLLDGLAADGLLFGVRAEDLEGIEMYRGVNQIPPEYYRYGMCGLAMLWTRADAPLGRPLTWRRALTAGGILGVMLLLVR